MKTIIELENYLKINHPELDFLLNWQFRQIWK